MIYAIETRNEPEPKTLPVSLPAAQRLDEIACPLLVIIGALDTSGTRASADLLTDRVAGVERIDFSDSAHMPNMEHPERFNTALREFFARHGF